MDVAWRAHDSAVPPPAMRRQLRIWVMGEGNGMSEFSDGGRRELENQARAEGRLPPGQSLTLKWPVLHAGSIPHFNPERWDFQISGEVEEAKRLTWNEFRALPQTEALSDFHCVTRWSRLD